MNTKKSLIVLGVVASMGVLTAAGIASASALSDKEIFVEKAANKDAVIEKVAANLDMPSSEVRSVLDEAHKVRMDQYQQSIEERLTQLVKDGKLTEEQKSKLLAKQAELREQRKTEFGAIQDKTKDEVHAVIKDHRKELEARAILRSSSITNRRITVILTPFAEN